MRVASTYSVQMFVGGMAGLLICADRNLKFCLAVRNLPASIPDRG